MRRCLRLAQAAAVRGERTTDLVDMSSSCPLCGFGGPRSPLFAAQADPAVEFLACPRCGGASASHQPSPERVALMYADEFYSHLDQGVTFQSYDRMARHILSCARTPPKQSVSILDFGGGDGSLSAALASRILESRLAATARVQVVDPHAGHVDREVGALHVTFSSSLPSSSEAFTFVLASASIEHVPNVREILPRLVQFTEPGGWFYARTPYVAPFCQRLPGLVDTLFPWHLHDLGPPFWNRVPTTYGIPHHLVRSAPSITETSYRRQPLVTLAANALKLPARVETLLQGGVCMTSLWRFVGGWEAALQAPPAAQPQGRSPNYGGHRL